MAKENWVDTDRYGKSQLLPSEVSQWRHEAEEFVKSQKAGGKSISPLDIEAKWSVTAVDDKAKGAIKYSPKDLENQVKREMATVLNRVTDDSGRINTKSQFYKQLEQIEDGRGPASQRIALALKHNGGVIGYSQDLTAIQERLQAAKERGPTPVWDATKRVIAKAEEAAAKALPDVVKFVKEHGGQAADFVEKHGGKLGKVVVGVGSVAAAGLAAASEVEPAQKKETFTENSLRVAKAALYKALPDSENLIEGKDMCRSAFSVASKGVGEVTGAGAGFVVGAGVGGLTTLGTTPVMGPAAPVVGALAGWKAGDSAAESVSSGVQNAGRKLSGMVCGA